jgi:tetratricopeptide (TPR) repeat protein
VRTPLKAALKAKHRGEVDRAEPYFRQRVSFSLQTSRVRAEVLRAIDAALSIPPSTLDPIPLLKVTGIYIALAAMLERDGRLLEAYKDLYLALALYGEKPLDLAIGQSPGGWAGEYKINDVDHLRIIGLEQKLGQLALEVPSGRSTPAYPLDIAHNAPSNWDDAAERHLSGAVKAMLQLGLSHRSAQAGKQGGTNEPVVVGRDIDLPAADEDGEAGRVDRRGLGMTMEHLAEVYARKGQYDLAGQLLLQAVSAILPPDSSQRPSLGDRCQGESRLLLESCQRAFAEAVQLLWYDCRSAGGHVLTVMIAHDNHLLPRPSPTNPTGHQNLPILVE